MIQEAVRNEAVNKRSLEIMLNYEEASKQQAPPIKRLATESNIRYYSKKGYPTTITFENMTEYPSIFREHNSVSCILHICLNIRCRTIEVCNNW